MGPETAALARAAQSRVGLDRVDHAHEVFQPDDPFELEPGPIFS
jgi:hypothetical protein